MLKKTLADYKINFHIYNGRFSKYDYKFSEIWNGIADGGIARIDIVKKDYNNANTLLLQNLTSSEKYQLDNDLAKIYNLLGDIQYQKKNPLKALDFYQKALLHSEKADDSKNNLKSLQAISYSYRDLQQFQNAYLYNVKYYQKKDEVEEQISNRKYASISEKLNQENLKNTVIKAENTIKKQQTTRNISPCFCNYNTCTQYFWSHYLFQTKVKIQHFRK